MESTIEEYITSTDTSPLISYEIEEKEDILFYTAECVEGDKTYRWIASQKDKARLMVQTQWYLDRAPQTEATHEVLKRFTQRLEVEMQEGVQIYNYVSNAYNRLLNNLQGLPTPEWYNAAADVGLLQDRLVKKITEEESDSDEGTDTDEQ